MKLWPPPWYRRRWCVNCREWTEPLSPRQFKVHHRIDRRNAIG